MRSEVIIPALGGLHDLEIIDILVKEGQPLLTGQPMLILETDKASMEIVSDKEGLVSKILVMKGDKVSAGQSILQLEEKEEQPKDVQSVASPQLDEIKQYMTKEETPKPMIQQSVLGALNLYAGPAVRKLARELSIDLQGVLGSGPQGRITMDDLKSYVREQQRPSIQSQQKQRALPDFTQWGGVKETTLSSIRQKSAQALIAQWNTIPHVTHFEQANVNDLESFRLNQQKKVMESGLKLSPLIFVIKAVVSSLKKFPEFNSSLSSCGTKLILKSYISIGIAVETPEGLVVPVIHQADRYSLIELALKLQELSSLARQRRLPQTEAQGQTFTISSLGGLGGVGFTPIINWPDVAILGVSKIQHQPQWIDHTWQPAQMMPLSLSYDHRVIDGAQAARFSRDLVESLEDIRKLLL
jgi:pyruvate dehydrogenase E2 component (dihydrolipoamide acetyltransferase)